MGKDNNTAHSSASYDVDNPSNDYVSQTDYHQDGTVHQYDNVKK